MVRPGVNVAPFTQEMRLDVMCFQNYGNLVTRAKNVTEKPPRKPQREDVIHMD